MVLSCNRHGVVAAHLTSERSGSIIPVPKTFPVCGVHSHYVIADVLKVECACLVFLLLTAYLSPTHFQLAPNLSSKYIPGHLIVCLCMATLTEVFRAFSSVVRQMPG